jgi:predicted TIM-barrel fold metal-dependent hydrolase
MSTRTIDSSRRQFLAGLAALGGSALLPAARFDAQAPAAQAGGSARRIDVHQHFGTPAWVQRNVESKRAGFQAMQMWTPTKAIEEMDKAGVATAMLSSTQPGVWWGDNFEPERASAISLAREMNEYGAKLVSDYKGRFGLFAILPLPDVDASLKEIAYAFDTLKADGVGLVTSYANRYIGEAMFNPVLEELNRRNAVIYSHPTEGPCCHNIGGQAPGTVEWFTDTARAILSVIVEGPGQGPNRAPSAATKYPNINYIWSHAGGSLIGLSARVVGQVSADDLAKPPMPNSRLFHVRRFFYDTAFAANPVVMSGLTKLLGGTSQIVFGTDYPFGGVPQNTVDSLRTLGFSDQDLRGIDRENVLKILPKYRG